VCELRVEKALEVLIEAAAILVEDFPALKVVIVGDGPERTRLEGLVEQLGLAASVLFLGWRSRETLSDVLDAFDVGVLSSDFEATPLSVIEFMAAGKPVVATRVGGVPGLIEDGREGMLVPPRDPASFARAVAALLGDPARRAVLGEQARERQRREFSFERMVRRIEDLYESLYWSSERGRRDAIGGEDESRLP
jgi:glycosyltransferase involved in cell wall biosynthesis